MRLEGAEPERGSGPERMLRVETQEEDEAEEDEDSGLPGDDADERRRKAIAEPFQMRSWRAEHLPQHANAPDEKAEDEKRPGKGSGACAHETERQSEGQAPRRIAHVVDALAVEAGSVLGLAHVGGV